MKVYSKKMKMKRKTFNKSIFNELLGRLFPVYCHFYNLLVRF
jgi:hypothetical protein